MTMDTFPRVLTVRQYEPIPNLRLTDIQPRLAGKLLGKYVALSSRNSAESLSALGNIGIFRLDPETLLNIVPRFDTRNLTYMVEACEGSWVNVIDGMMREYPTGGSAQEWLSTVLRTQYVKRCTSLYTTGLLRGYRRKHVVTSSPCGRIEMGRSISLKARGIVGKLACSYEERTIDIPENSRLFRALMESELPGFAEHENERKRLLELFDGVSGIGRHDCRADDISESYAILPENWHQYRELLDMAWMILHKESLSLDEFPTLGRRAPSLCVDFQHLFEEYVRRSIRDRFEGRYRVFDGNKGRGRMPLYEPGYEGDEYSGIGEKLVPPVGMTADCDVIVRESMAGRVLLAAECKCTFLDTSGIVKREEAEQAMVYAIRFGLPYALVIHPVTDDASSGFRTPGRIGPVTMLQYNINIDADDVRSETERMLDSLEQLLDILIKDRIEVDADAI